MVGNNMHIVGKKKKMKQACKKTTAFSLHILTITIANVDKNLTRSGAKLLPFFVQ